MELTQQQLEFEAFKDDVEAFINTASRKSAVEEYLKDEGEAFDDSAPLRYEAADEIYEKLEGAREYDAKHGVDASWAEQHERTPVYAMVHEKLYEAWEAAQENQ